jgi:hypothetical protein
MPSPTPCFGPATWVEHKYGYVVFVQDEEEPLRPGWRPDAMWFKPINDYALALDCTLVLFDGGINPGTSFKTWDWEKNRG